jgi:Tfp pilus assembly protein PilN
LLAQKSIGIDIRHDRICVACIKKTLKRAQVSEHMIYSLDRNIAIREKLPIIREVVQDFLQRHAINAVDSYLSIPADLVIFKELEFPLAVRENLRSTLKYEMEKHVPLPLEEIFYDYHILSENRSSGKLKIILIVAKKSDVRPYLDFVAAYPGGISGMEIHTTALANCLAYISGNKIPESDLAAFLESPPGPENFSDYFEKHDIAPELAVAFGLALQSGSNVPVQINILPDELRKKPGKLGRYMMSILILAVLVSGLAWGGSHFINQRVKLKTLDAEISRIRTEIKNIDKIRSSFPELERRIGILNELSSRTNPVLDILRELSQTVPTTAWVRDFLYSKNKIQLEGKADSASELIPILEASPMFKDVHFLSTITKDKSGKENMRIELIIENATE